MAIMTPARRIAWTLFAIAGVAVALTGVADDKASAYGGDAFQRALVTFAVARALNGVISVAQGTEVAVEPGGVGVNFGVGQILDPVNDLVERFSTIMLLATSSLGLQNFLLPMVGSNMANVVYGLAALALIAFVWWPGRPHAPGQHWLIRLFLTFTFIRFAVPVLIVGSNLVFNAFLASEQQAALTALQATSETIESINEAPAEEPTAEDASPSLLDRIGSAFDDTLASVNVAERMQHLRDALSNASEHIINLIVIFVLQTIVFPLMFVWLLAEGLKSLAGRATGMHH